MLRKRTSKTGAEGRRRGVLNLGPAPVDAPVEAAPVVPSSEPLLRQETLGLALRAVRLEKGLSLEDVALTTRVRRAYLEAIEEMRLDALPSRPFTIGYIRAFAGALGLNPELAIERFKSDEPVLDEPLRAPVGVLDERDPRVAAFLVGALVIIAAIVLWNVAQRSMMANAPAPPLAPANQVAQALRQVKPGTVQLGPPLPAPVESTIPPPYETPGLAEAMGLNGMAPQDRSMRQPKPLVQIETVDVSKLPQVFTPKGRVYDSGNPRTPSQVTVQALKSGAVIARGPDGSVYFARQLSEGDAYRVPDLAGLTLDVSAPHDFQVFVAGQSRGVLPAQQVLVSKLAAGPTPP